MSSPQFTSASRRHIHLPNEILSQIIFHAVKGPKILYYQGTAGWNFRNGKGSHPSVSPEHPPAVLSSILSVSRFFRSEGLKHYRRNAFYMRSITLTDAFRYLSLLGGNAAQRILRLGIEGVVDMGVKRSDPHRQFAVELDIRSDHEEDRRIEENRQSSTHKNEDLQDRTDKFRHVVDSKWDRALPVRSLPMNLYLNDQLDWFTPVELVLFAKSLFPAYRIWDYGVHISLGMERRKESPWDRRRKNIKICKLVKLGCMVPRPRSKLREFVRKVLRKIRV